MSDSPTPQRIAEVLDLRELDVEGGLWSQSWRNAECSAIYYLLAAPDFSALHRLDRLEIYSYHAGAPLRMLLLSGDRLGVGPRPCRPQGGGGGDSAVSEPVLGLDVAAGQRPQVVVPAGTWQGSTTLGAWTLMGTVVVPPYTDDCVEFGVAERLCARYPRYAARIKELCR